MPPRLKPGFAFWLVCDLGFAVGIMTHHIQRFGHVIWMAEPMFAEAPDMVDVEGIQGWRWPVLFPLGAAVHRKIVTPIGVAQIPTQLVELPVMRSNALRQPDGWKAVALVETGGTRSLGRTEDRSLPIYQTVNDVALKEMLVSGWTPERDW